MNEKRTERKINLNFLILLAFIAVLGTILILFVPVTGTGDREFVPTVMIAFAIGCLIGLPIIRAQKKKNTETPEQPASTRALATGVLDSVYMRSSQNGQPNSDTPDMNSRKER